MKLKKLLWLSIIILIIYILSFQYYKYQNKHTWKFVINTHIKNYSNLYPADIYKIIYQGTIGSDCLYSDRNTIYKNLKKDMEDIYASKRYSLIEQISPDGKYIRINLKKYKYLNGDIHLLTELIYLSNNNPDYNNFDEVLTQVSELISKGKIDYNYDKWFNFYNSIPKRINYVPYHSEFFMNYYRPSYRVILKKIWDEKAYDCYQNN